MATQRARASAPRSSSDDGRLIKSVSSSWEASEMVYAKPRDAEKGRCDRRSLTTVKDRNGRQLLVPLSELAKDMAHVPIKDMESWVRRSTEIRLQEANRKHGKVTRPMNAFFLYQQSYRELVKEWLVESSQSILSTAVGRSWRMETQAIRDSFEALANIDKKNHMKAHPFYKPELKKKRSMGKNHGDNGSVHHFGSTSRPQFPQMTEGTDSGREWDSDYYQATFGSTIPQLLLFPEWTRLLQISPYPDIMGSWLKWHFDDIEMLHDVQNGGPSLMALPGTGTATRPEHQLLELQDHWQEGLPEDPPSHDQYYDIEQGARVNKRCDPIAFRPPSLVSHQPRDTSEFNMKQSLQGCEARESSKERDMDQFDCWINYEPMDIE
ncbi:hypothetical protein BDV29DRAFT_161029 [Aspergillus leporis]|uniref:HMG box domain-containing protein n=1 Tax=Aspergillus leporis TaxID=41062 RepID=A0A5N5WPY8_9EURO|nr:hypothetical protein BDV29DRAFT_161029 [Aspergillus leporis]